MFNERTFARKPRSSRPTSSRAKTLRRWLKMEMLEERRLLTSTPGLQWLQTAELTASSDFQSEDHAGQEVAISGNTIVVSSHKDDEAGSNSGAAYVFTRDDGGTPNDPQDDSWVKQAKLMASDAAANDEFGLRVAIDGDTIVVGAPQDTTAGNGMAYVFQRSGQTWTEVAKLTASDGAPSDRFGVQLAIEGNTIVATALRDDDLGVDSGSAYVFAEPPGGWSGNLTETTKLTASDGAAHHRFGRDVNLLGDTLIIGADQFNTGNGAAYVFHREDQGTPNDSTDDIWTETSILTASDAAAGDQFGMKMVLHGSRAVVTAVGNDHSGVVDAGAAYVFERQTNGTPEDRSDDTWLEVSKLMSSDAGPDDQFGRGLAMQGDLIVVGAWSGEIEVQDSGSAYFFERQSNGTWIERGEITAANAKTENNFGTVIAIEGNILVVGDPQHDRNGVQTGGAFVYTKSNASIIASDLFESGSFAGGLGPWSTDGGWTVSGDASIRSDTDPNSGAYHARLRRSTGDLQRTVDVTDFSDIRLQFDAKLISLEGSDRADVKVSGDGSTWTTLLSFFNGDDDGQYKNYDLAVPDVGNTLHIRFDAGMSGTADYWFIDNVEVVGTPSGPPQVSIGDATATEGDAAYAFAGYLVAPTSGFAIPPGDVVLDGPNGDFYVSTRLADGDLASIVRIDRLTGEVDNDFIPKGTGGLDIPREIAINGEWIYVANEGTNEVLRFNKATGTPDSGPFVPAGAQGLSSPHGLIFDDSEVLYVSSRNTGEILRYDVDGTFLGVFATVSFGTSNLGAVDMIFDAAGDLLITTGGQTLKLNGTTGERTGFEIMGGGRSIAIGPDGDIFLTTRTPENDIDFPTGEIRRYDPLSGVLLEIIPTPDNKSPWGITFDSDGNFYVALPEPPGSMPRYAPGSSAAFTVSLSTPSVTSVSVDFTTTDSSALAGSDYDSFNGTLAFEPGVTTRTIIIPTIDDAGVEGPETFTVKLSNPTGGAELATDHVGEGTIIDDDASREITISDATVTEGDATLKNFGIFVSEGSGGLIRPRTNIFGPDRNSDLVEELYVVSADTGEILVYDGATGEFLEPFITGVPELQNAFDIAFGDGYMFANSAFDPTKIFRFDANTGAYVDSLDVGTERQLGFTFAKNGPHAGDLFLTDRFKNEVRRYDIDTQTSTTFVTAGSSPLVSPWKVIVGPDDNLYVASQGTNQVLKYDGSTGEFLDVVAADVMASAIWMVFDDAGYLYLSGSLETGTFRSGLVRIDVNTGSVGEILELELGGSNGLNIGPNDVFYVSGNASGNHVRLAGAASNAVFEVTLSQASSLPVSVDYTIMDQSAVAGSDYVATSGTLVFQPGETTRTIVVPTIDDSEVENDETFIVTLSNPGGAVITDVTPAVGTIVDNDFGNEPPVVDAGEDQTLSDADATGSEAVTLVGSAVDTDGFIASVSWTLAGSEIGNSNALNTNLPVGTHALTFTATDNEGASSSDTVVITVLANRGPTADAGDDQITTDSDDSGSQTVTLVGTGSDQDGDIVGYEWKIGDDTLGTTTTLETSLPIGTHTLTLIVTDNGGATASDTVDVTVNAPPSEVVLFEDSFEVGSNNNDWNGKWLEDSQNDFFRSTQRSTEGSRSAEVDGWASNATLTLATTVDLTGYTSSTLTFDWLIESGFDKGEYLSLDVSVDGGDSWFFDVRRLSGNVDSENTWHSESVDLGGVNSSNLLIRFRSYVTSSSEDANVDNVRMIGSAAGGAGNTRYSTPTWMDAAKSDATRLQPTPLVETPPAFDRLDVNQDGHMTPLDVLLVVNWLNQPERETAPENLDTNADGRITPLDTLLVVNRLNQQATAEGESAARRFGMDAQAIDKLFGAAEEDEDDLFNLDVASVL